MNTILRPRIQISAQNEKNHTALGINMILKQVYSLEYQRVQDAFKNLMIHEMQFTIVIAICYVLHRCESLEIRC